MKLSDMTAKLTCSIRNLNGKATRVLAAAALAGAALATIPAAQAQHFAVGVQIGGPRYYAPPPPPPRFVAPAYGYGYRPDPGYWERRRYEDWRRHEAWRRHEFEQRDRFYGPRY